MTSKSEVPVTNTRISLTQRALLTLANSSLEQGVRFLIAFFAVPIIIHGLGADQYGAWIIIQQTIGYVAITNLRPGSTLKLTLGRHQYVDDTDFKQRQIGATLLMWAITFPIVMLVGSLLIVFAPVIVKVDSSYTSVIRIVVALALLNMALNDLLNLPATTLRAMNMDYKAMGLDAFIVFLGGFLSVLSIWFGLGIVGVAASGFLGIVIQAVVYYSVVRRNLTWFKPKWPSRTELFAFFRLGIWVFLSAFGQQLLLAIDLILIGVLFSPSIATIYASTEAAMSFVLTALSNLLSSGNAGVVGLVGQGDWARVERVRTEIYTMILCLMTVFTCGITLLNRSFVSLWLGETYFGGINLSLLVVLLGTATLSYRFELVIVDAMLKVRNRTIAMVLTSIFSVVIGTLLSGVWGLEGLVFGLLIGRLSLLVYTWILISNTSKVSALKKISDLGRLLIVSALLILVSRLISDNILFTSWPAFVLAGRVSVLGVSGVLWFCALRSNQKQILANRLLLPLAGLLKLQVKRR